MDNKIESERDRRYTRSNFIAGLAGVAATAFAGSELILRVLDAIAKEKVEATAEMVEALNQLQHAPPESLLRDIRVKGIPSGDGNYDEPSFFNRPKTTDSKIITRLKVGVHIDRAIVVLGRDPAFPTDSRKTERWVACLNPDEKFQVGFVRAKYLEGDRIDTVVPYSLNGNSPKI